MAVIVLQYKYNKIYKIKKALHSKVPGLIICITSMSGKTLFIVRTHPLDNLRVCTG